MSDLWGAASGQHQADIDMSRMALEGAHMRHLAIQDMMAPVETEYKAAQARLGTAKARGLERTSAIEDAVAAYAMGGGMEGVSASDPAAVVQRIGDIRGRFGDPTGQSKAYEKASVIRKNEQSADTNAARATLISSRARINSLDELARNVRYSQSPEDLQSALINHAAVTGEVSPYLDQQTGRLRPEAVENWVAVKNTIQDRALSEQQKTVAGLRQQTLDIQDRSENRRAADAKLWQGLKERAVRVAEERLEWTKKQGNLKIVPADIKIGTDLISSEFDLSDNKSRAAVYGREIAEKAIRRRAANPAITMQEAAKLVMEDMIVQGRFEGLNRKSGKPDLMKPLPLPVDAKGNPAPDKLIVGQYYVDGKNGSIHKWSGQGRGFSAAARPGGTAVGKVKYGAGATSADVGGEDLEADTIDDGEED